MAIKALSKYIQQTFQQRFDKWLSRRMPCQAKQQLTHKNVFIFPSRFGLVFLLFVLLLFLLGTNYQNNLILLLSYLFISLFVTSMLYSFFNLSGITVSAAGEYLGFAEQTVNIPLTLIAPNRRFVLRLSFIKGMDKEVSVLEGKQQVQVPVSFTQRGGYQLPRLTMESYFAFGLFRCWTHLQFDLNVLICPKPSRCLHNMANAQSSNESDEEATNSQSRTNDNFYELKNYRPGEPLNQVAWKQLAKTGHWYAKSYQSANDQQLMLSLAQMPSHQLEAKLANLCFLILEYNNAGIAYGIELAGQTILPQLGKEHCLSCLKRVANYGH